MEVRKFSNGFVRSSFRKSRSFAMVLLDLVSGSQDVCVIVLLDLASGIFVMVSLDLVSGSQEVYVIVLLDLVSGSKYVFPIKLHIIHQGWVS